MLVTHCSAFLHVAREFLLRQSPPQLGQESVPYLLRARLAPSGLLLEIGFGAAHYARGIGTPAPFERQHRKVIEEEPLRSVATHQLRGFACPLQPFVELILLYQGRREDCETFANPQVAIEPLAAQ